mmetsp:Transcript_34186/g.59802  ORF Transcript_34186/g.59802 Transcript_34186/m.59802 type:complete len:492 (-) Transcript_34186:1403-2878(-)
MRSQVPSHSSSVQAMLGSNFAFKANPIPLPRRVNTVEPGVPVQNLRKLNVDCNVSGLDGVRSLSSSRSFTVLLAQDKVKVFNHNFEQVGEMQVKNALSVTASQAHDIVAIVYESKVSVFDMPKLGMVWVASNVPGTSVKWHYQNPQLGVLSQASLLVTTRTSSFEINYSEITDFDFLDSSHIGLLLKSGLLEIWKAGSTTNTQIDLRRIGAGSCANIYSWTNSALLLVNAACNYIVMFNFDTRAVLQRLLLSEPITKSLCVARSNCIVLYSPTSSKVTKLEPGDTEEIAQCTEYLTSLRGCWFNLVPGKPPKLFIYDSRGVSSTSLYKVSIPTDFAADIPSKDEMLAYKQSKEQDCYEIIEELRSYLLKRQSVAELVGQDLEAQSQNQYQEDDSDSSDQEEQKFNVPNSLASPHREPEVFQQKRGDPSIQPLGVEGRAGATLNITEKQQDTRGETRMNPNAEAFTAPVIPVTKESTETRGNPSMRNLRAVS